MKITNHNTPEYTKEENNMKEPIAHRPPHPVPPHIRKGMFSIQFDDNDWEIFKKVFVDEDEAAAAFGIIHGAPPEIQILAAQLLYQIEKEVA